MTRPRRKFARIDPKEAKDAAAAEKAARRATAETEGKQKDATFRAVAEELIEGEEADWRNPKHWQQWRNTLRD